MNIGNKISAARRELGITQVELADKMSVTRQYQDGNLARLCQILKKFLSLHLY